MRPGLDASASLRNNAEQHVHQNTVHYRIESAAKKRRIALEKRLHPGCGWGTDPGI